MDKKNLIIIFLLSCLQIFAIDTEFYLEKYLSDTFLPEPTKILAPVYDYNELSFCYPQLIYFFSKHFEKNFSYSFLSLTDFKDSIKLDLKFSTNFQLNRQKILFENNTQITNKKIILSKLLFQKNFSSINYYLQLNPRFYVYPTLLSIKNLSNFSFIYNGKFFIKSNYQNFTDFRKSYIGYGIISDYGNFGVFYSTLFFPFYSLNKNLKNFHINLALDAIYNERDTLGILSKNRTKIYSIFPLTKYVLDLNLQFSNIQLNISAIKVLENLKTYNDLKMSQTFYDFGFYVKNETKNTRYSFSIKNFDKYFHFENFYVSFFSLNKIKTYYLENEIKYIFYNKSVIYNLSLSFDDDNCYFTFGIKNLLSKNDPVYSFFSKRTYFFLFSFSNLQFLD